MKTGRPPISVQRVCTNEGNNQNPNVRARLVARQICNAGECPLFAPTPPLDALRSVLSTAATDFEHDGPKDRRPESEGRWQVSFVDISRAHFNAKTDPEKPTYVALPTEHPQHETHCGLLMRHMYGTQAAADGWQHEYARTRVDKWASSRSWRALAFFRMKNVNLCARCTVMISAPRPQELSRLVRVNPGSSL